MELAGGLGGQVWLREPGLEVVDAGFGGRVEAVGGQVEQRLDIRGIAAQRLTEIGLGLLRVTQFQVRFA